MSEVRDSLYVVEVKTRIGAKRWERYQIVHSKKEADAWVRFANNQGTFFGVRYSKWEKVG